MSKEIKKKQEVSWVDVKNDDMMVKLGLRYPKLAERNENLWKKSPKEKETLKVLKSTNKIRDTHFHSIPRKFIPVQSKIVVYLKKNNKFPKTTYSMTCWQSDIDDIISFYRHITKNGFEENLVSKYTYNGKTYKSNERPYWFGN